MAEVPSTVRAVVRSLNREMRRGSLNPRSSTIRRSEPLPRYIQALVRNASASTPDLIKRLENLNNLIINTRVHGELLARYNPVYGKSEAERIRATAMTVGWDVPVEYQDANKKVEMEEQSIDQKYRS